MPGLGTTLGRGGATTAQQDLANSDAILIMGSSMAENHPVGFQWVIEAREKNGAKIIHVDPRFTRTSAMCDYWLPLRAGSDIIFLGALINFVLTNERDFREYVVPYTNASVILRDDFRDTEDLGGMFSGWDEAGRRYDPETWGYEGSGSQGSRDEGTRGEGQGTPRADSDPIRDLTLQHPRCVFQVMKRHFARYTPEMVERACGIPAAQFVEIAEVFVSASGPEKTGAICYAVGWTQHATGVQTIRAAAILQLLLGNIGRPGGGIMALRGHASIQGSTDIPTLFDILPGYLPMPSEEDRSLSHYLKRHRADKGWWFNIDNYLVSLLKAYYGDAATRANDFAFDLLPRLTGDHSYFGYWLDMADGKLEGLLVMGQNPAVGSPNAKLERKALGNLKWLVVRDMVETETSEFWQDDPDAIGTEVFFFPAASYAEKEGTFTNTQRLLQWREKAVDPPGEARSELHFMVDLGRRLKAMATDRTRDAALRAVTWDYEDENAEEVLREIHGRRLDSNDALKHFGELKNDGSTSCGCWIYSGVFDGENRANARAPHGKYDHGWGYAWPLDRRILYNRASARPDGKPWSERKALVWWDEEKREWVGHDVADFTRGKPPDYRPLATHGGDEAIAGDAPFIMHPDGLGWLWVASGLKDGPLPTHYEPLESVVRNPMHPGQQSNPAALRFERPDNPYASSPDERFPHVLTTYRLTEHHTAGAMSRTLTHLAELQPELFAEISPELAHDIGIGNGERVRITTARGSIEARALVTTRMPSLDIDGQRVHQVGLPYHWGGRGLVTGDVVNDLLAISEEPNVRIFESKGLTCDVRAART
ncbi:MAG: molybdopterin-dependent oxidoreductase [Thermoanaerobaculia bacterium]|nr:molybdopterin-dependent oxidoreductase [Thermoanaerobaculia bacterium]